MQKLLPPILALLSIILMVGLSYIVPIIWISTNPIVAGILICLGLALLIGGSRMFAQVDTNIKTFNDPNKLVTTGLFRFSRNPMYLGFTCLLTGIALVVDSLSALLVALAFFLITNFWYIAFEEQTMERVFGQEYLAYKQKTRRWL